MIYNEYRPHTFSGMVGQKAVTENLLMQSRKDSFFGVYIMAGQFGSGKTTAARVLAMALNCENKNENGDPCCRCPSCKSILNGKSPDYTEIDGASNNGVDAVRSLIETVKLSPLTLRKRVVIIDEVHMLSKSAFNALLKTLEEPPTHSVFILCTTEEDAIPKTVRSRSAIYRFLAISENDIFRHIKSIAEERNIKFTDDAIFSIAKASEGSMRNALSLFEQVSVSGEIDANTLSFLHGALAFDDAKKMLLALIRKDRTETESLALHITRKGTDLLSVVHTLIGILTDMCLLETDLLTGSDTYKSEIKDLLDVSDFATRSELLNLFLDVKKELRMGEHYAFFIRCLKFVNETEDTKNAEPKVPEEIQKEESLESDGFIPVENDTELLAHLPKEFTESYGSTEVSKEPEKKGTEEERGIDLDIASHLMDFFL